MKFLSLHCDYIKFKPLKKALKKIARLSEKDKKEKTIKEPLVVLTAVEKHDSNIKNIVEKFVEGINEIAEQLKANTIVLYPYAHLSSNLASPEHAINILEKTEKILKKNKKLKVHRAPFGYYKEFEMKVKGHPLSELSREIKVDTDSEQSSDLHSPSEVNTKQLLREISKAKLDTSKLKENDHRIIGKQMDLFSFNDVAPGMVFWHNNGLIIRDELIDFAKEVLRKNDYELISTPEIMDKKLWQVSGHWDKYKENNFVTEYEKRQFLVKPMNCPGGLLVYKNSPKSYRDFPLRTGEFGTVHRHELSGVLAGLLRVVEFVMDDAHVFCTEKQLNNEIIKLIDLTFFFYDKFKLNLDHIELSTRPEIRIGTDKMWDKAEKALEQALKKRKIKYKLNKGDGAFYGPKIDFHVRDSLSRNWQLGTIQLDFSMPERFNLEYVDKDNKRKRPVMLHRAIYGSLERFIGILIEHYNGRFPTWLAPIQVRILNFTDRNKNYAEGILKKLREGIPNLRIDADFRSTTVPAKVKDAELQKIPYIIVVGDREQKDNSIAVRRGGNRKIEKVKLDKFIKELKVLIKERK